MTDPVREKRARIERQPDRLAGALRLGNRVLGDLLDLSPSCGAEACHVQHQPRALARLPGDGQPRELLQRIQDGAVTAHQVPELTVLDLHDGHHRAVALDVHVDVAVQVGDVEQALEVVGRQLALTLEQVGAGRGRLGLFGHSGLRFWPDAGTASYFFLR